MSKWPSGLAPIAWPRSTNAFFDLLDWTAVPERAKRRAWPGPRTHPRSAYIKALLVKLKEGKPYISELRRYLVQHPVLVLLVGFVPEREAAQPYGFNVETTVPCERWLRAWQQHLDNAWLQSLLAGTVHALQAEIPGLGETVATDVKHIFAWVQQNNPKAYVSQRFDPARQPRGDRDCRLGVKRRHNQDEPDGTSQAHTDYVWGYGTGLAS